VDRSVVGARRRGAARRVVADRDAVGAGGGQADGEDGRRRSRIALGDRHVVDRDGEVVVEDRAPPLSAGDGRADRVGQVVEKRLVGFVHQVAVDQYGGGGAGHPGGEGERAACRLVIPAGSGRGAVGGGVVHRHRLVAGPRQVDGEDG